MLKGKTPPSRQKGSHGSKLYLVVSLYFSSTGEYIVSLHCHFSQVHSVRVPSVGQIDLFKRLFVLDRNT